MLATNFFQTILLSAVPTGPEHGKQFVQRVNHVTHRKVSDFKSRTGALLDTRITSLQSLARLKYVNPLDKARQTAPGAPEVCVCLCSNSFSGSSTNIRC